MLQPVGLLLINNKANEDNKIWHYNKDDYKASNVNKASNDNKANNDKKSIFVIWTYLILM